jgi:hypothetical protein
VIKIEVLSKIKKRNQFAHGGQVKFERGKTKNESKSRRD